MTLKKYIPKVFKKSSDRRKSDNKTIYNDKDKDKEKDTAKKVDKHNDIKESTVVLGKSFDIPIQMYDPKRDYQMHKKEYQEAINTVLEHGKFVNGPEITELETKLATYIGVKHCVAVANGTDALQIALMAAGIEIGDEVITVAYSWISTAGVISIIGAKPVFIDIEPNTFNMNPDLIEKAITEKTKAIIPVSLYGQMPDYDKINKIAEKHGLVVIEDGAQSFGATSRDGNSCGVTLIGSTSFFPSKPMGCWGDGGALFTNDDELAEKIRGIKNHGCIERFKHRWIGMNSRLDTLQASILLVKMKYLNDVLDDRRKVAEKYNQELSKVCADKGLIIPMINEGNTHVWAQYSLLLDSGERRDRIFKELKEKGVNVAIFYPSPLHIQECFQYLGYKEGDLPVTEDICNRVINLPCYGELTEAEQNFIIKTFINLL